LAQPSKNTPAAVFSSVDPGLFEAIVNETVQSAGPP
jgi:hypothetical protein